MRLMRGPPGADVRRNALPRTLEGKEPPRLRGEGGSPQVHGQERRSKATGKLMARQEVLHDPELRLP
jgi:hypothetical protein